jgi:selenocysteine-specific elongation factor
MSSAEVLEESNATIRLSEHQVVFTDKQKKLADSLLNDFRDQPYTPPTVKQSLERIDEALLRALIETGQLIQLGEDVLFLTETYQEMREAVISHIQAHGSITLAELRDRFDTSRKYAVAVLEHLDQTGVTIRKGDTRILRRRG